jgi:hypothetical protein
MNLVDNNQVGKIPVDSECEHKRNRMYSQWL